MKRPLLLAAGAALLLLNLAGCGAPGSSSIPDGGPPTGQARSFDIASIPDAPGSVTLGSADFPESEILAQIYADAMRARGVTVTVHNGVGERPAYLSALKDGSIGAIPEYSGSILDYLDTSATAKSSEDVYNGLQQVAADHGFVVTNYSPAQDADTITVTKRTAEKYNLKQIGDLAGISADLRLGAPAPFLTVPYGVPGLKSVYGVGFGQFVPLSASGTITQAALANGAVDAADIFSTDPSIAKNHFVILDDPKHLFNAQNVVPLFRQDVLTKPMKDACDAVSARLTTENLRSLLAQGAGGANPADIAHRWITENGLG
jgi:osmoprotectant transport system substrate-binding protein